MVKKFEEKLKDLLGGNERYIDKDGDLIKSEIIAHASNINKELIELLIKEKEAKNVFFEKIGDYWVFNQNKFIEYIQDKNVFSNSVTKFESKIGLNIDGKYLNERGEVSLVWPFKDCVLEGGMTKEDQKRNEIFFNEILAKDEIDRLEDPKVLINFKKHTQGGEEKVKKFERDETGTIKNNLIIKGNNLLALHSLKKEFAGKVKLVYIDPPFYFSDNKSEDTFAYNPNFKLSTWLTFIKNRLEIAKELISVDGFIFIHIGSEDASYANLILDEVFGHNNYINHISVKTTEPTGFKTGGNKILNTANHIFIYRKETGALNKVHIEKGYDPAYKYVLLNKKDHYSKWKYKTIKQHLIDETPDIDKEMIKKRVGEFAISNPEIVFRTTAITGGALNKRKATIEKSSKNKGVVIQHPGEDVEDFFILNCERISFWKRIYKNIDNKLVPAQSLSDIWTDISWTGISPEGRVKLNNGKKPEKLLKRVIELATQEGDLVLDYHLGSGTTCATAHKMGRQYIGIEQMDYGKNSALARLDNVISGDSTGISKTINWGGEENLFTANF